MMFLCLCYYDAAAMSRVTPAQLQEIAAACAPHDVALRASDQLVSLGSLSEPETWVHFVPKNGKPSQVSGPYRPGPRQAGAFFIVDAVSTEEAHAVASRHAAANYGEHIGFAVEVCACEHYDTY